MIVCLMRERTLRPTALAALAAFVFTLLLAVAPYWHQRLHSDSARPEHQCVVTLVASGKLEQSSVPALPAPQPLQFFISTIPSLISTWVAAPFLGAAIFEHAPPAFS
jgi:hypothetical protein